MSINRHIKKNFIKSNIEKLIGEVCEETTVKFDNPTSINTSDNANKIISDTMNDIKVEGAKPKKDDYKSIWGTPKFKPRSPFANELVLDKNVELPKQELDENVELPKQEVVIDYNHFIPEKSFDNVKVNSPQAAQEDEFEKEVYIPPKHKSNKSFLEQTEEKYLKEHGSPCIICNTLTLESVDFAYKNLTSDLRPVCSNINCRNAVLKMKYLAILRQQKKLQTAEK